MKSEGLVKCVCVFVNTGGLNVSLCNKCSMHLVGVREVRFLGRLEVYECGESMYVGGGLVAGRGNLVALLNGNASLLDVALAQVSC
jgi:hypothetical protein